MDTNKQDILFLTNMLSLEALEERRQLRRQASIILRNAALAAGSLIVKASVDSNKIPRPGATRKKERLKSILAETEKLRIQAVDASSNSRNDADRAACWDEIGKLSRKCERLAREISTAALEELQEEIHYQQQVRAIKNDAEKKAKEIWRMAETDATVILDRQVREIIRERTSRLARMGDSLAARGMAIQEGEWKLLGEINNMALPA
jgi:hypothetical protein